MFFRSVRIPPRNLHFSVPLVCELTPLVGIMSLSFLTVSLCTTEAAEHFGDRELVSGNRIVPLATMDAPVVIVLHGMVAFFHDRSHPVRLRSAVSARGGLQRLLQRATRRGPQHWHRHRGPPWRLTADSLACLWSVVVPEFLERVRSFL